MNAPQHTHSWIATGTTLTFLAFSGIAARADLYVWQESCASDSWYACCEGIGGWYNNWFSTPIGGEIDCPGPTPSAPDDVDLLTYSVYLNQYATVYSLLTSGPFRLLNGDVPGQLNVYTTATFNDDFFFDEGAVVGFDGWDSAFEINYAVAFRTSTSKEIVACDFNVYSSAGAVVLGTGDIVMGYGATLNIWPESSFEFDTDASITNNPNLGGHSVNNEGLFRKVLAGGTSRIDVPFNNSGDVEIEVGMLQLNAETGVSTGSYEIASGAVLELKAHTLGPGVTFTGEGLVRVTDFGHVVLQAGAALSIPDLEMAAASLNVGGSGDLQVTQTLNWLGGIFQTSGTTTLAAGCLTTLSGDATKGASFGTLSNAGSLTWTGNGQISLAFGTLNNLAGATFEVQTDADSPYGGTFNNAGSFIKSASSGETALAVSFTNTGSVEVQSGRLTISEYNQTTGSTTLNGGDLQSGSTVHLYGGELIGSGTVYAGLSNDGGSIRPGLSAGSITVTGTFSQAGAAALDTEIGGTLPGTGHDQIIASAFAILDGTINVSLIDGFVPEPGDEYELITYPARFGNFATVNLPATANRRYGLSVESTRTVFRAAAFGDWDIDGNIDLADHISFYDCLSGPDASPSPTPPVTAADCLAAFDFDADEDVDLHDAGEFMQSFGE